MYVSMYVRCIITTTTTAAAARLAASILPANHALLHSLLLRQARLSTAALAILQNAGQSVAYPQTPWRP